MGAVLAFLVVLALPTGWLYDLWAGTGTEQGRRPEEEVRRLQGREEIEACFLNGTPATVDGGAKRPVYVSEYITADYPLPAWEYALQRVAAGGFTKMTANSVLGI